MLKLYMNELQVIYGKKCQMHVWYGKRSKKWRDWPWDTLPSNVNTYTPDLTALFYCINLNFSEIDYSQYVQHLPMEECAICVVLLGKSVVIKLIEVLRRENCKE